MREISAELIGGPFEGRTGRLQIGDEPPSRLVFSLADRDDTTSGIVLMKQGSIDDELAAVYELRVEKPRKVITYDDNGRARSELGARYVYSREHSPCERLFERADADALLTAEAHEQVMQTRRLLLDEIAKGKSA
jgi:hypothetical protein